MKKLFPYFLVMAIFSCETEPIIFTGPYFVRFTESTRTEKESYSKPIDIEVHNAGPALETDINISFKISGSAREGVDYTILSDREKVTIEKGQYLGYIKIQLINNANNILRSQDIIFTLQNVSPTALQVGQGESFIGKTFTFTIVDDCILSGTYTAKGGGYTGASDITIQDVSITSTDCEKYTFSPLYLIIEQSYYRIDLTFIDNGDNTLTIPSQVHDNLPQGKQTISGKGSVDPLTRGIMLTIILEDYEGKPARTYTVTPS